MGVRVRLLREEDQSLASRHNNGEIRTEAFAVMQYEN